MLVQRRRDTHAALRLMRKLLKKQGFAPKLLVTDKLRLLTALAAVTRRIEIGIAVLQPRCAIRSRSVTQAGADLPSMSGGSGADPEVDLPGPQIPL
jgi:hypothetical protein